MVQRLRTAGIGLIVVIMVAGSIPIATAPGQLDPPREVLEMDAGSAADGTTGVPLRSVDLQVPGSALVDVVITVTGEVTLEDVGLPSQSVTLLEDGQVQESTQTAADGSFAFSIRFDERGTYEIQAAADHGTLLEDRSDTHAIQVSSLDEFALICPEATAVGTEFTCEAKDGVDEHGDPVDLEEVGWQAKGAWLVTAGDDEGAFWATFEASNSTDDGPATITATARDAGGNQASNSTDVELLVDQVEISVSIVGATAVRHPDTVEVWVDIEGTLQRDDGTGLQDARVDGNVTVTKDNPCWDQDPDQLCPTVIDTQTEGFETDADSQGSYAATVGPFEYTATGSGPTCHDLGVEATAGHGTGATRVEATDEAVVHVCA